VDLDRGYSALRASGLRDREWNAPSAPWPASPLKLGERRSPHKETAWDVRTRCYSCVRACVSRGSIHIHDFLTISHRPRHAVLAALAPLARSSPATSRSCPRSSTCAWTPTRLSSPAGVPLNGCITIIFFLLHNARRGHRNIYRQPPLRRTGDVGSSLSFSLSLSLSPSLSFRLSDASAIRVVIVERMQS